MTNRQRHRAGINHHRRTLCHTKRTPPQPGRAHRLRPLWCRILRAGHHRPQTVSLQSLTISHKALQRAIAALGGEQQLQQQTGAVHGAAWCSPEGEIQVLREDVGRHNALDKLLGAISRQEQEAGFVLVTSRASYEMVAKTASANIPLLAAVSAPTSLAIELAEQSGLTLVGFSRTGRHVIYTNGHRLTEV